MRSYINMQHDVLPILAPSEQRVLWQTALGRGGEFGEVFLEYSCAHTMEYDRQLVKTARTDVTAGAGVRVLAGSRTGYAHTCELSGAALRNAAAQASYIADNGGVTPQLPVRRTPRLRGMDRRWPDAADAGLKASLLREADAAAREYDPRVAQVTVYFADRRRHIMVLNTEGLARRDNRHIGTLLISCIAESGGRRDYGSACLGGPVPFDYFTPARVRRAARKAARQAVRKLGARECPAGEMPVVIGRGWGGVLVHEAVGHGLELDFIRKQTSLYTGRVGQQVASKLVTIIDDGTIRGGRGTVAIDDEGTKPQRTILIRNGVLEGFLSDRLNAGLTGHAATGNGRRESFEAYPLPRMTNTFIDRGADAPSDLIASVKFGLYARQLGGGQVDITSGNFVFEVSEGQLIEHGRLTAPVRGATLVGNGPDAMTRVTGVGRDLALERTVGTCGKDGQSVPVGVGQPTILIERMTVGGTRA